MPKIIPSDIKLNIELSDGFNFKEAFLNLSQELSIEIVDVLATTDEEENHFHWYKNNCDTIVFRMKKGDDITYNNLINYGKLIFKLTPDEYEYFYLDGEVVVKMWWET